MKPKARFAKAFSKILRDPRISPSAKTLLHLLKTYADAETKTCYPSAGLLASCLGVSRRSIFAWLKELESHRLVKRLPRFNGSLQTVSTYSIEDEHFNKFLAKPFQPSKKAKHGVQNLHTKGVQNLHTEGDPCKKSVVLEESPPYVIQFPKVG